MELVRSAVKQESIPTIATDVPMGMWVYFVMIFPTMSSPPVEALTEKRIA